MLYIYKMKILIPDLRLEFLIMYYKNYLKRKIKKELKGIY